jgi:ribonuclease VapC
LTLDFSDLRYPIILAGEVYCLGCWFKGSDHAAKVIPAIATIAITEERVWAAARLKAEYPIAYADAFAAALTIELGAKLFTGDPAFKSLEPTLSVKQLPGRQARTTK